MEDLSYKEQAFVVAFLKCFNGTRAATIAGYQDPGRAAGRLRSRPRVAAVIEAELQARHLSATEALEVLSAQAHADMADFAAELGFPELREARDAGRLDTRLIHEFDAERVTEEQVTKEGEVKRVTKERARIKLHNSQSAATVVLKVRGGLEETFVIRHEQTLDELFAFLVSEFGGQGDEAVRDRLGEALKRFDASRGLPN